MLNICRVTFFRNSNANSNPASNATWYPNSTNHLFSFTESGWFFRLLRRLPQTPANKYCSGTQPFGLRLRDQRSLTIERKDRRPPGQRSVIFFKLGKQRIYVISIKVIKEGFVGFLRQCLLFFRFRTQFIESIDAVNMEAAS